MNTISSSNVEYSHLEKKGTIVLLQEPIWAPVYY